MSVPIAARRPSPRHRAMRFLNTPKGNLLIIFAILGSLAIAGEDKGRVILLLAGSMGVAAAIDISVAKLDRHRWVFPSGGLLTAVIVVFLISPYESWIVPIAATVLAIASKHLVRTRLANVFNPAALALVVAAVLFHGGEDWWGALAGLGWPGVLVLLITGGYIANRINKLPMVLSFLGAYVTLFTAMSFADPGRVSEIFRAPDVHMALFFTLFMLDDPPTSPVRYGDQVRFGLLVAVSGFVFFEVFGWLYFLPAALLVGNAFEALRKRSVLARRAPAGIAT